MKIYLFSLPNCDHREMSHQSLPHFPRDVMLSPFLHISLHYFQDYCQYVYTNFGSDKLVVGFTRGKDFVPVYIGQRGRKEKV